MPDAIEGSVERYDSHYFFLTLDDWRFRCLQGHMGLDNMAMDSDDFRQGYGTLLCRHGMDMAKKGKVPVVVLLAAEMGTYL
jgi:hypothetical protein